MLLLLPPSETKRDGGDPSRPLDLAALAFPELTGPRRTALDALRTLTRTVRGASEALRLGPTQRAEVERDRAVLRSPTMPALDRYTGVLYDALGAAALGPDARAFAARHLLVHSALFGLVRALDPIPAYRLSHDSRLPGTSMRRVWRQPIAALLATLPGPVVDLRSEAYVALGPCGQRDDAAPVRVLARGARGARRALAHVGKQAKGRLVRAVVEAGEAHDDLGSLVAWAREAGFALDRADDGTLELLV